MKSNFLGWFLLVSAMLFSAWIYALFTLNHIPSEATIGTESDLRAAYGALGDYFGGLLNPFFGFVGMCLLLLTLHYTRKDLNKTDQALEHQKKEAIINRYTNNIFQLCSVMHTRIHLVEIEEGPNRKLHGYQAFQHFVLLNRLANKQQLHDDDLNNASEFLRDANHWSFLELALQTLEYFEGLLDDGSLKAEDKVHMMNIMDINVNFEFLSSHCVTLKEHSDRLEDKKLNPFNQSRLRKVDLIIQKLITLEKYRE